MKCYFFYFWAFKGISTRVRKKLEVIWWVDVYFSYTFLLLFFALLVIWCCSFLHLFKYIYGQICKSYSFTSFALNEMNLYSWCIKFTLFFFQLLVFRFKNVNIQKPSNIFRLIQLSALMQRRMPVRFRRFDVFATLHKLIYFISS